MLVIPRPNIGHPEVAFFVLSFCSLTTEDSSQYLGRIRRRTSSGDANTTTEREVHPLTTILDDSGTPSRFWKNAFKQYCVFYMKDPVARSIECVMTITKSEALRRRNARLREINTRKALSLYCYNTNNSVSFQSK